MRTAVCALAAVLLVAASAVAQDAVPTGVQVGATLPAMEGVDLRGQPVSLPRPSGAGTVVLSFWSIHCADCIRELDDLRSIRREFAPEQVTIVAVNTDSGLPVARVAEFVRRYEAARGETLRVLHLLDRNAALMEALGIRYIPLLIVADREGRVTSVVTGYAPEDKARMARALEEGRVALGAWSEGLRARLRVLLRGQGAEGRAVEWGSFRVEEGMALFGLYDASGWIADAAGRRNRAAEAGRVEGVVAQRLKVGLLRAALGSVGVRLPAPAAAPFQTRGMEVPEGPLTSDGSWKRLYEALSFDTLFQAEQKANRWVGDEYWAGLVGDVDLGALRQRLGGLSYPLVSRRIRLETVSDFDFKSRALFEAFRRVSYRLQAVDGQEVVYYGDAETLADELRALPLADFRVYVEASSPDRVRAEIL
ncbi:MAG: TlpA family protein disulfide reductase [Deltaproteobacteria bacterium]|nr:TlpA family protein disulfide reductase [Deltaproteobacteria bacterium]